jgi:hypothetical protein
MNWRGVLIKTALAAAVATWAVGPGGAEAQVRQRKPSTRITAAQRKAAAEARKARMAGGNEGAAAKKAAPTQAAPAGAGGTR